MIKGQADHLSLERHIHQVNLGHHHHYAPWTYGNVCSLRRLTGQTFNYFSFTIHQSYNSYNNLIFQFSTLSILCEQFHRDPKINAIFNVSQCARFLLS